MPQIYVVLPMHTVLTNALESRPITMRTLAPKFWSMSHDLARGLQFLHDHKFAHMDIKPDNLVYTSTYELQIIDFNLAVDIKHGDTLKGIRGTEFWMAPGSSLHL